MNGDTYTTPPYTPEDDKAPNTPDIVDKNDIGGEKAAKAKILKAPQTVKRVSGGTRYHQNNGWLRGK